MRAGGIIGAALLVAAELTTLIRVHSGAYHTGIVRTITAGSHHSYALIPVAVLAVALALLPRAAGSRPAAAAMAALGLVALVITVVGDLPDVHRSGLLTTTGGNYVNATSSAGIALYLETLGGLVLLLSGATGLLLAPVSGRRRRRRSTDTPSRRRSGS